MSPYGLYVVLLAAVIAGFNFWMSWLSQLAYRLIHGSLEGDHFVEGVPLIGTPIVPVGLLLSFGHIAAASLGLLALVMDTHTFPWFVVVTWRDRCFWDEAPLR